MKTPLVSIIIVSYKNYHYIYQALHSVLSQDYPNIELIISNDGSDDFDKTAIKNFLNEKSKKNIKSVFINNNPKNIGTVKNLNKAISLSKGEYIVMFAADDTIYNKHVISKFINAFSELSSKELIVTSQVGMFDKKLKKLIQYFVSDESIEKIKSLSPKKLFAEMSTRCMLPGVGTCYKREIFKKHKIFDEKYILVEDYSSALKLSRLGIKYNYYDFISFKHRDGGISHGNILKDTLASKKYDFDILSILKYEVKPYLNLLNSNQKKKFIKLYREINWKYQYNYEYINGSKIERRKFLSENIYNITYSFFNKLFNEFSDQIKGKKFKILYLGIFFLTVYHFKIDYMVSISSIFNIHYLPDISNDINRAIGTFGLFLIVSSTILTIFMFIKKYLIQIYRFIRFIF